MDKLINHFKKNWVIYLVGSLVLLGIYSYYRWKKPPAGGNKDKVDPFLVLKLGDVNESVRRLQKELNLIELERSLGLMPLTEDAIFGELTEGQIIYILGKNEASINELLAWSDTGDDPHHLGEI